MAVAIRLKRFGTTKDICFRIVVCDERAPRDGKVIEEIGFYDPAPKQAVVKMDVERAKHWVSQGARITDTVRSLMKKANQQKQNNAN